MEVSIVSDFCLKIKGKQGSIIVDPRKSLRGKVESDAILIFDKREKYDDTKVEGYRVIINGPGEYEISGIKVSASKLGANVIYQLYVDNVDIILAFASSIEKAKEKLSDHHILILLMDEKIDFSTLVALEPRIAVMYGGHAQDIAQKDQVTKSSKLTTTEEKLPEKMETILLQ